jgi:hypothetical protein
MDKSWYTELVPVPPDAAINTGLNPCPTRDLVKRFGSPRVKLTDDCMPVTSSYWKKKMVTKNVGPFRATGHILFLNVLTQVFSEVKNSDPVLYRLLGSAGCLCCRRVRGSTNTLSNHGLGLAIDVLIDGKLDTRGDDKVFRGLLELYKTTKKYDLWWGAEFTTEDAMHFEASAQLVRQWDSAGLLK